MGSSTTRADESVTWVTYYGLGGITIAPGKLSLGVTSPAVVTQSKMGAAASQLSRMWRIPARVRLGIRAAIWLPPGLALAPGQEPVARIGNLAVGESVQISWQVEVDEKARGEYSYQVRIEADNSEPNQVKRQVKIVTPASLQVDISGPPYLMIEDGSLQPVPFAVRATIRNVGQMEAPWVQAQWQAPLGLQLAPGETRFKLAGDIGPDESRVVQWFITPTDVASDNLPYSVRTESGATDPQVANGFISIPQLPQLVALKAEDGSGNITWGTPYKVIVQGYNLRNVKETELVLRYPVNLLKVVGGRLGVEPGQVFAPYLERTGSRIPMQVEIDPELGLVWVRIHHPAQIEASRLTGSLCALRLLAVDEGHGTVYLDSARFTTSGGQIVELGTAELPVHVSK